MKKSILSIVIAAVLSCGFTLPAKASDPNAKPYIYEMSIENRGRLLLPTSDGEFYIYTPGETDATKQEINLNNLNEIRPLNASFVQAFPLRGGNTALIGSCVYFRNDRRESGFYYSDDDCKTWTVRRLPGDCKLNFMQNGETKGRIFAINDSNKLLASGDAGYTWQSIDYHNFENNNVYCFHMADDGLHGLIGGQNAMLFYTDNAWQTSRVIKTPGNRHMLNYLGMYAAFNIDDRVEKAEFWGKIIVVRQGGFVFFGDDDELPWSKFKPDLCDFRVTADGKKLIGIDLDGNMYLFTTPFVYTKIEKVNIPVELTDFREKGGYVYLLDKDNGLYRVSLVTGSMTFIEFKNNMTLYAPAGNFPFAQYKDFAPKKLTIELHDLIEDVTIDKLVYEFDADGNSALKEYGRYADKNSTIDMLSSGFKQGSFNAKDLFEYCKTDGDALFYSIISDIRDNKMPETVDQWHAMTGNFDKWQSRHIHLPDSALLYSSLSKLSALGIDRVADKLRWQWGKFDKVFGLTLTIESDSGKTFEMKSVFSDKIDARISNIDYKLNNKPGDFKGEGLLRFVYTKLPDNFSERQFFSPLWALLRYTDIFYSRYEDHFNSYPPPRNK